MTKPGPGEGGYRSMAYARSLGFAGRPFRVDAWGTPVLLRPIADAPGRIDAMGPYPLCQLDPASDIRAGLDTLRRAGVVSVVLVPDPLAAPDPAAMARHFTSCRPFKTHYILDRAAGPFDPSGHHRQRIRRGLRRNRVRSVPLHDPGWRARWVQLYGGLVHRKALSGIHAFPDQAFEALSRLRDGCLTTFAAESPDGETQAMQLWIGDGERAYCHLTAGTEAGHRSGAAYALYAAAAEHFGGCRFLDFGGGAGMQDTADDGLAAFKRGFANATRIAHLCGAILDPQAYAVLSAGRGGTFFPRYRAPGR